MLMRPPVMLPSASYLSPTDDAVGSASLPDDTSTSSLPSSLSSDSSPLLLSSSSADFSPQHVPGPSCPEHCHSHCWQQTSLASLSTSPSSTSSFLLSSHSSASLCSHSSSSLPSSVSTASIEAQFPAYPAIYPVSTLPELLDAHAATALFREDCFTEVNECRDGPSVQYDLHTHPTHNAHYIFRGDLHVFYPQLQQSVYYKQGDRFDIPAELIHTTTVGSHGCVFMMASKRPEARRGQ